MAEEVYVMTGSSNKNGKKVNKIPEPKYNVTMNFCILNRIAISLAKCDCNKDFVHTCDSLKTFSRQTTYSKSSQRLISTTISSNDATCKRLHERQNLYPTAQSEGTTMIRNCKLGSLLMEIPVNAQKIMQYAKLMKFDGQNLRRIALTYADLVKTPDIKLTPLILACFFSKPEILEKLVKEGYSVNYVDGQVDSPLRIAFNTGNIPAAEKLIELGADPTHMNIYGIPPMEAVLHNFHNDSETTFKGVKLLLKNGVSVNTIVNERYKLTALHLAVYCDSAHVVKLLLLKGADPNTQSTDGSTPLHAAVSISSGDIFKLLLSNGGTDFYIENAQGETPLLFAVRISSKLSVETLIKGGCDVNRSCNERKTTPLFSAVNILDLDMVKLLVGLGADPNKMVKGGTALHVLANRELRKESLKKDKFSKVCEEIAEYLIENGGDINYGDITPLEVAVYTGNLHFSKLLISLGANVNPPSPRFNCLATFIVHNPNTLLNFLEYGFDYNPHDDRGLTPYHYAIQKNIDVKFIRSFVKQGCPYNQNLFIWKYLVKKSNWAIKSFFEAERNLFKGISQNNLSLIMSSIKKGAIITSCSEEIKYPLHFAAYKGYKEVLLFLLEKGVPPNCVNEKGETPLYIAVKCGHNEICCILLRFGACYNVRNKKCPITPEMVARDMKHESILDILHSVSKMFQLSCSRKRSVILELEKKFNNSIAEYLIFANCINLKGDTILGTAINNKCYTNVKQMLKLRLKLKL